MEIADMFYNKDEFVETASGNKVNNSKESEKQEMLNYESSSGKSTDGALR